MGEIFFLGGGGRGDELKEQVMITDERTSLTQNFSRWVTGSIVLNVLGQCFMCCMLAS